LFRCVSMWPFLQAQWNLLSVSRERNTADSAHRQTVSIPFLAPSHARCLSLSLSLSLDRIGGLIKTEAAHGSISRMINPRLASEVSAKRSPWSVLIIIGASRATRDTADARRWTRKSDRTHLLFSARPKLRRPDYAAYLHRRSTPARKSHIPDSHPDPRLIRGSI